SRIVLLKGFSSAGFVFYTNLKSQKAKEIEANPVVTLHFPWLQIDRQVIASGTASRLPAANSQAYFATRPRESQLAAWASDQSNVIPSRQTLDDDYLAVEARFAGKDVPMPDFWGGFVVAPHVLEFWQGGEKRLHDRFRYTREANDHWRIERLSP
ncbi:MAG TPA: pyridoxamine 5'-phosphate oxidase, partial [Anaerolineales bacterium]